MDIRWRRSSGGADVSGEAIAAEEKVSTRTRSIRKGVKERMVVAVIATEEECKEVPSCTWRATDPTTHSIAHPLGAGMDRKPAMLKPSLPAYGTSTSYSVRDGLLPIHPLVLGLPATLRAPTLTMMRYTELAMRPSTDVIIILTALAALLPLLGPKAPSRDRTFAIAPALPPWLVARHHQRKKHP